MRQLDNIGTVLKDRNLFILVNKIMRNVPIELSKAQKDDEEGNLLTGEYYAISDLEKHFGKQYEVKDWVDENHILALWSSTTDDEMMNLKIMLEAKGMTNILKDVNGKAIEPYDVDWVTIPEYGFAILSLAALRHVPKVATPTVEDIL